MSSPPPREARNSCQPPASRQARRRASRRCRRIYAPCVPKREGGIHTALAFEDRKEAAGIRAGMHRTIPSASQCMKGMKYMTAFDRHKAEIESWRVCAGCPRDGAWLCGVPHFLRKWRGDEVVLVGRFVHISPHRVGPPTSPGYEFHCFPPLNHDCLYPRSSHDITHPV